MTPQATPLTPKGDACERNQHQRQQYSSNDSISTNKNAQKAMQKIIIIIISSSSSGGDNSSSGAQVRICTLAITQAPHCCVCLRYELYVFFRCDANTM